MKGKLVLYGIVAVIVIAVGMFSVSSRDVATYNDQAVAIIDKMDKTFEKYMTAVSNYCDGKQVDTALLKKEMARIDASLKEAGTQINATKVPDDDACKNFHKAIQGYVNNSEKSCALFKEINEYVAAHNPPQEADTEHITEMLLPLAVEEEKALTALKSAQASMASKHKMKLK